MSLKSIWYYLIPRRCGQCGRWSRLISESKNYYLFGHKTQAGGHNGFLLIKDQC